MIDVVDLFLSYGGDPTIKNKSGFTCLHLAARDGRVDIAKLLLNKGKILTFKRDFRHGSKHQRQLWIFSKLLGQVK